MSDPILFLKNDIHIRRAVSAALHTPQLGGATLPQGPKIQTPHHWATQGKLQTPKFPNWNMKHWKSVKSGDPLKEKCLYITVNLGSFESKVFTHCNCCWGPFESKVAYLYVTVAVGPIDNNVLYTLQLLLGALWRQSTELWCGRKYLEGALRRGTEASALLAFP